MESVIAFANTQGGSIIIGIRDSDRCVIGLRPEQIDRYTEELPQVIADAVSSQIAVDLYEQHIGESTCMTLRIYPGPQRPYFLKRLGYPKGVFIRFGSHNRRADEYAIEQFARSKSGIRYEQTPCPGVSIQDLSADLLQDLFLRADPSILIGSGYGTVDTAGRVITNVAGALLFYSEHKRVVPESSVVVSQYAGTDKRDLIRKEEFTGGLIPILEHSFALLSSLLGTRYGREGLLYRPVDHQIPLPAVREALVNAVAHRAYDYESPTRITLFSDRIEFLNPGTFFAPINPENLTEGLSRYRNPLIADALRKKGFMEKQGIGINLILSSCRQAGLSEPRFLELEHHVKLVIFTGSFQTVREDPPSPYDIASMREHFAPMGLFTSRELAGYLGRSTSLAKKILQELQRQKVVKMVGKGPASRYRFL